MKEYNMLQAIFMSFYSAKLYRDVAWNWGGKAIVYLLFLLFLSWIPMTFQMQYQLNELYDQHANEIVQQVPIITIKNGKISTPEPRPYFIKIAADDSHPAMSDNTEKNVNLAVIDTTGSYTNLEQANTGLLITQTDIIYSQRPNDVRIKTLPNNLNMIINPEEVNKKIKQYSHYFWIPFLIFLWIGSFIYRLIQVLLYSVVGKIFAKISGAALSYAQVMQIMMVALTPVIVLSTILEWIHIPFEHDGILYFALAMIFLFYGIIANKNKT